ncbi:MAG TPA: M48 family metallopeptidase [Gammaproteobacteria bacterium]|nr:M48 family metallopeptidase [Gammaproteobacteria bacterium]
MTPRSMSNEPVYYEPPAAHDNHLRKLAIFLTSFFGLLFLACIAVFVTADRIVTHLPFSFEQRFVRPYEVFAGYLVDEEPSEAHEALRTYLGKLAQDLARRIDVPTDFELTVHYVDDIDTVNAFATLGGHIFVFSGLLKALPDENSLAMVLAHEIAHIKNRDPIAGLGRVVALQMLYAFVAGSYADYGGELGLLFYSREKETAADVLGITAIQGRYGHVGGAETLLRLLMDAHDSASSQTPTWTVSHPDLEDRIAHVNAYAAEQGWMIGTSTAMPKEIQRIIAGLISD